jgi:hypothetical protein
MRERSATPALVDGDGGGRALDELLAAPVEVRELSPRIDGVVIGQLVAITDDGTAPLVTYPGQAGTAALRARAVLDVHGEHIGREVVLTFENADPARPVILGCLHDPSARSLPDRPGQVEMDVDGQRLVVTAKEQLVLRCGKASITLTKAGKVLIEGGYISSRSSGVNRVKGGSVQLN